MAEWLFVGGAVVFVLILAVIQGLCWAKKMGDSLRAHLEAEPRATEQGGAGEGKP